MATKDDEILDFGKKVTRVKHSVRQRLDGFRNLLTGLGTTRDKTMATDFWADDRLQDETLDAMYNGNHIVARIAETVPNEMLRQGFDVTIDADDEDGKAQAAEQSSEVMAAAKSDGLSMCSKFVEAMTWGRLFGGAALVLGADDGAEGESLALPLNEEGIRSFKYMNVIDKRLMHPVKWYDDPTSPNHGKPMTYMITPQINSGGIEEGTGGGLEIHESRMIVFGGAMTTIQRRRENGGWDSSVIQAANTAITQFGTSWQALTHIIADANQAVFKMDGLIDSLAEGDAETVESRMAMLDMNRSVARSVVLDAEHEDFTRHLFHWTGMKEVFEMLILGVSSAAKMPATMLMGQSPDGMNATGQSDIRWFYDSIKSSRALRLEPQLERAIRLLMLSKDGPTGGVLPDSWRITFPPLWQTTPEEDANVRKTQSETDKAYVETGVLLPEEVAMSRFPVTGWSPETTIDLEVRQEVLTLNLEKMEETAGEPETEEVDS